MRGAFPVRSGKKRREKPWERDSTVQVRHQLNHVTSQHGGHLKARSSSSAVAHGVFKLSVETEPGLIVLLLLFFFLAI